MTVACDSIRDAIVKHLTHKTVAENLRNLCVVSLPIRTMDGRQVDVFVEPRGEDYFLVHDAGKAANELILSGVNLTDSINKSCSRIAGNYKVGWSDDMFQTGCKLDQLSSAAMSIAMCSALATVFLLEHSVETQQPTLHDELKVALRGWQKRRARLAENEAVAGKWKQHTFDFVIKPKAGMPIAISILNPAVSAISSAERFGFKTKDLEGTHFEKWRNVAVTARAESWSGPAMALVTKCSDAVIELRSNEKPTAAQIGQSLDSLLVA